MAIKVDPQVLLDTGNKFNNRSQQVTDMISALKGDMGTVFGTFEGASANKLKGEWEKWASEMPKFAQFLSEVGGILKKEGDRWLRTDQG